MRLDDLVVTVTRLLAGRFVVQFPAGEADFCVFQSYLFNLKAAISNMHYKINLDIKT